ncbi:hypothetical protein BZA77DRAFT_295637 [Pyronema omphalodes]|nr:hypothetical protein BZA77DRAFT_295637 [Pyronema omphalodes]
MNLPQAIEALLIGYLAGIFLFCCCLIVILCIIRVKLHLRSKRRYLDEEPFIYEEHEFVNKNTPLFFVDSVSHEERPEKSQKPLIQGPRPKVSHLKQSQGIQYIFIYPRMTSTNTTRGRHKASTPTLALHKLQYDSHNAPPVDKLNSATSAISIPGNHNFNTQTTALLRSSQHVTNPSTEINSAPSYEYTTTETGSRHKVCHV